MQDLSDAVPLRCKGVGELGCAVDGGVDVLAVVAHETFDVDEHGVEGGECGTHVVAVVVECLRHGRETVVKSDDPVAAERQCLHEDLEIPDGAEQVLTSVRDGAQCSGQLLERLTHCRAVPLDVGSGGVEDFSERALRVVDGGSEFRRQSGEFFGDLVPFDGHGRPVERNRGPWGEFRSACVRGGELNEPRRHQRRGNDRGLRVGGNGPIRSEGHANVVAAGFDVRDAPDLDAHHPHIVADVQAAARIELGGVLDRWTPRCHRE